MDKNQLKTRLLKVWSKVKKIRSGSDPYITACMILLAIIGVLMTGSTSVGMERGVVPLAMFMLRQFVFIALGIITMNFASNTFRFSVIEKHIFGISLFFILFICIPLGFTAINGAKAWIPLGPVSIQPSEFFKVFSIVLVGVCVDKARTKNFTFFTAFRPLIFVIIGAFIIVGLQKDFGTAMIISLITLILVVIPYHQRFTKVQGIFFLVGIIGIVVIVLLMTNLGLDMIINLWGGADSDNYQVLRFVSARNPFLKPDSSGFQLIYGLEAIARGGLTGVGFGASTVKFLIPEGRTDYIITIIIEELGLIGFLFISIIMFIIIARLVYFALHAKNEAFKIILLGVALYFSLHYIFNVGGVSGLIPLTGIPLLIISAGGTSLMSIFTAIGICQCLIAIIKRDMIGEMK